MDETASFTHVITQVEWLEEKPLMVALLSLYVTCCALTIITWKHINFQALYFLMLCASIYWAESLNRFLAKNIELFSAKHQYFDANGLFISVVYSTPLLLNLLVLLFHWIRTAASSLILVKRHEIRQRVREKEKKDE